MADDVEQEGDAPKKKSKMPLILGLVLALAGGGGGFFATWSGILLGDGKETKAAESAEPVVEGMPDVAFVPLDPLTISLNQDGQKSFLIFRAQLEVPSLYKPDVEALLPRVVDVLNSYLRAVQKADLEHPSALVKLRSQMLRRIQIVTGEGRVNDLLVMEFVVN